MKLNRNPHDEQLKLAQEKLEKQKKYQELILEHFKPEKDKQKENDLKASILKKE